MRLKCYNYNEQMRPERPQVVRGKQEVANITIGETKKSGNGGENQKVHGDHERGRSMSGRGAVCGPFMVVMGMQAGVHVGPSRRRTDR